MHDVVRKIVTDPVASNSSTRCCRRPSGIVQAHQAFSWNNRGPSLVGLVEAFDRGQNDAVDLLMSEACGGFAVSVDVRMVISCIPLVITWLITNSAVSAPVWPRPGPTSPSPRCHAMCRCCTPSGNEQGPDRNLPGRGEPFWQFRRPARRVSVWR